MQDGLAEYEACVKRVAEGAQAAARCDALTTEIRAETARLEELKRGVEQSEHRVVDLDGRSLAHVLAALRRRADQELDAAQAEVRAAQLELATRQRALKQLTAERDTAQARASALDNDRRALRQAREQREAAITQSGGEHAEQLRALQQHRSQLIQLVNECHELEATANQAERALGDCLQKLNSAGNWATYDTFFHGGILAASMEHQRVDEATLMISASQAALQRLGAEIQALHEPAALLPEVSPGLKTANIWFDNIFSDWMVRSRINASQDAIETTRGKVTHLVMELRDRQARLTGELNQSDAEYTRLLSSD